jgi:hypothetical protein
MPKEQQTPGQHGAGAEAECALPLRRAHQTGWEVQALSMVGIEFSFFSIHSLVSKRGRLYTRTADVSSPCPYNMAKNSASNASLVTQSK